MGLNQKENELHVYSINENEHIVATNLSFESSYNILPIVVLDYSSAAGDAAERLVKEVLPLVMSKMKHVYQGVRIFTFGDESVEKNLTLNELSKLDLKCGGATKIGPAIEKLRLYFERCSATGAYFPYVLTISAGEISDRENAERETKKMTDLLATKNGWRINSQAVRLLNTSNNHRPDTKALSYLLQINNTTEANICDINVTSSNETIASGIAALFTENVEISGYFNFEKPIISRFPWQSLHCINFVVSNGWNIFWLSELPTTKSIKLYLTYIANQTINVVAEGQLTLEKFQQLMEKKLPHIISHMKILKIVGTAEANEAVDQIFSYFTKTEEALAVKCSTPNTKIVTNALAGVAMYRPNFRDSDEMLEFYRNFTKTKYQIEMDRLKKEKEEEERQNREKEDREKREQEKLREQEEREKSEQEERLKKEELERQMQQEKERRQQEDAERLKRDEEAQKINADNNNPNLVQKVFILDEQSFGPTENRRLKEKIVPLMLSNIFQETLHLITLLRHATTAAETLQTLVKTLDATKTIQIAIITNEEALKRQESENFAEKVMEFLNGSGYSYDVQVMKLALPTSATKRYKLVEVNATDSDESIAEQIVSMMLQ